MEDDIEITITLDEKEIDRSAKSIGEKLKRAFNVALGGSPGGSSATDAHFRRIEALTLQHSSRLQQIEARKQASIDLIRERSFQKEVEHQRKIEREAQRGANSLASVRSAVAGVSAAFGALASLGIVSLFERFGRAAVDAAISVDKQINSLKALTGSAETAQKRFQELFRLAQQTPGLTTNLAATLDAQLRIFDVNVRTIDRLLPVIGRLNAISPLGDPRQFVNNLTQLITQNFERSDLKELVGQSPIAASLIRQIFNVSNPTNADAIRESAKKLSINTVERLAEELVKAAATNSALQNATESVAGRFEKMQERINLALAPIGNEILKVLLPIFGDLVNEIERVGPAIARAFRDNQDEIRALASAVGAVASAFTSLGDAVSSLDSRIFSVRNTLRAYIGTLGLLSPGFALQLGINFERKLTQEDAEAAALRGSPFLTSEARTLSQATAPSGRRGGGAGGSAATTRARRSRFVRDFGLGAAANLEHEAELARIRQSNADVAAKREALQEAAEFAANRPGQLAGFSAAQAERLRQIDIESLRLEEATAKKALESLQKIEPILSNSERFMRGFGNAVETVGDAFERFGNNVARAFGNVRDLFNGLKSAVLGFFNDLVGNTLQNLVRRTLGPLFGGSGGGLGNLFRTPSFAGGDGIAAPPSLSGGGLGSIFSGIFGGGGGGGGSAATGGGGAVAGAAGAASRFSLGGLLGGLAGAAPLLGLGLGSGFGGQSTTGQILGAVGGGAVGLGVSFGSAVFGAGGGLAQAGLAALGPIGLIGVPLLIGAALLGKAKQRRADEAASGEFLTQALQGIEQLAAGVASGQIPGSQARSIFDTQILGTFRQQINTLKTESVRRSRLTNQVRDLENVYNARILPLIDQQEQKAATSAANAAAFSRQIPEFATGGTTRGGLAFLHPGEKIVNFQQQSVMRAIGGPDIFERAGVPGPSRNRNFDIGGTMSAGGQSGGTIEIHLGPPIVVISEKQAQGIYFAGAKTDEARGWTVKHVKDARKWRELP